MRAVFTALIVILSVPTALAAPIGQNWTILIQSLKDKGVTQIGKFNIDDFARRAAKVPFHPIGSAPPSVMAGSRGSAFYTTTKPPQIYILSSLSESDEQALAQLEVHELMGALGDGDADTAKSAALAAIDRTSDASERSLFVDQLGHTVFAGRNKPSAIMIAGGFSVGGGGDIDLIRIKNEVYEYARKQSASGSEFKSSEFSKHFFEIDFEPLRHGDRVALNYIFRFPSTELLSVYVPKGSESDLVREIATKLLSIFPARTDEPMITLSPRQCRHGESLRIPRPSDDEVANIQTQRARFLLGCKVVPQESGGTSTSGETEAYAAPDRAGIFNFDCAVQAPGQAFHLPFSSAMGTTGVMVKAGTLLSDNDSATFTLLADATGKIKGASLSYRTTRYGRPTQIIQSAKSPASVTVSLANPAITMTCTQKP